MQNLDITLEDTRWAALDFEATAERAITAVLQHFTYDPDQAEVSVLACDDVRIAILNGDFRAKPNATNVLSWPGEERGAATPGGTPDVITPGPDGLLALGDIAIAYDTCAREADAAGKPVAGHVIHLIVHATLHLMGYDHETAQDAALMEGLEVEILGKLGLDNPYNES